MRRRLVHVGAWALATGSAVTLCWYGVHTVVSGTAYDPPRGLPITEELASSPGARPSTEPEASSTQRPKPSPSSGSPTALRPSPSSSSSPGPSGTPGSSAGGGSAPGSYEPSGNVRSFTLNGGRVAFDLGPDSATLVSATPRAGWEMRVWKETGWIRVTFTRGEEASSVHCVWHDSSPRVQVDEHQN